MYHGHPGTDFQCRCSMVMWDPEIDGDYEVKDSDLLERKEAEEKAEKEAQERAETERREKARAEQEKAAEALRNAKEEVHRAEAERKAAERARVEAEKARKEAEEAARKAATEARKARLEAAAVRRHAARTPESEAATIAAWNARRIRRIAEARHAARTAEREKEIREGLQRRLGIREDAKKILAESDGINGVGREDLENAAKGGNAKSYGAMERKVEEIGKRLAELKALQHVGDPMAAAKKYGYPDTIAAEKAVESTLNNYGFSGLSNKDRKTVLENEIAYVKKRPGNVARLEFMAYDSLLDSVITEYKWEVFKSHMDTIKAEVKAHPKSQKLAAAYGKLEEAFNARNDSDFFAALTAAQRAIPKAGKKAAKTVQPKSAPTQIRKVSARAAEIIRAANERHAARTVAEIDAIKTRAWVREMPKDMTKEDKKALAKNWLEIERTLGIKKGRRMTVEEADKQSTNPKFWSGKKYQINCQTCAPAYMLRLWGFDVKAKGKTRGSLSEWISHSHSFDIWKNADGSKPKAEFYSDFLKDKGYKRMTAERYDEFFEEKCKDVGIYVVTIGWSGKGAHATILQRLATGKLVYVEPQKYNGNVYRNYSDGLSKKATDSNWKISGRGVMRIDDKIFDSRYLSIFEK